MFMRFRGGGIGHRYMRQVEPWLDTTGWGASWPSFDHRSPEPILSDGQGCGDITATEDTVMNGGESGGSSGPDGMEEESEEDEEDDDGNLQQPDEDSNDLEQSEEEAPDDEADAGEVEVVDNNLDEEFEEDTEPFPSGFISL